jgi:hypothetical protein
LLKSSTKPKNGQWAKHKKFFKFTSQFCFQSKQNCQNVLTNVITRTKDLLELVHSNMCGAMENPSWGGAKYFITFTIGKQWLI